MTPVPITPAMEDFLAQFKRRLDAQDKEREASPRSGPAYQGVQVRSTPIPPPKVWPPVEGGPKDDARIPDDGPSCPAGPFTLTFDYSDNYGNTATGFSVSMPGYGDGFGYPNCTYQNGDKNIINFPIPPGGAVECQPSLLVLDSMTGQWSLQLDIAYNATPPDFASSSSTGPTNPLPVGSYGDQSGTGSLGTGYTYTITNISIS